jgi:hypothetical protein
LADVDSIELRSPHWYTALDVVLTVHGVEHLLRTKVASQTKHVIEAFSTAKQTAADR